MKPNPRKRPASMADVKRAKEEASDRAVRMMISVFIYVLKDKFAWRDDQLAKAWQHMNKTVEMIGEGRLSVRDINAVLGEEYGITVEVA